MDQRLTDTDHLTREQGMEVARHAGEDAARQAGRAAGNAAATARRTSEMAGDAMEQAKTVARNVGEQAWSAAAQAGTTAQDLAQRARTQIDPLYQQGMRAGEILTRNVNDYPLAALLIAGMIGYLTAFLIHRSWQSQ